MDLKQLITDSIPKLQNKKIYLLTGTGDLKRTDKIELLGDIDTFEVASNIFSTMTLSGFKKVWMFPVTPENINCLELLRADVFLNIVEGVGANFVAKVTEELKKIGIPFTGSESEALKISTDKNQTKTAVSRAGVKVAPSQLFRDSKDTLDEKMHFPIILKPKKDDGSAGITNDSVVSKPEELKKYLEENLSKYPGPLMGEQFVDGREFSVTVIEVDGQPFVLPIAEVHFPDRGFHGKWKIYNYAAKWVPGSPETKAVYANAPAKNLSYETEQMLSTSSLTAFKTLNLHDYARFDFRQDEKTGDVYFLEANANPSLEDTAQTESVESYKSLGLTQTDFLSLILKSALERFGKKL